MFGWHFGESKSCFISLQFLILKLSDKVLASFVQTNKVTYFELVEIRPPDVVHQLDTIVFCEVSQVGDEGCYE